MKPKYAVLQKIRNGKETYGITPHIPGGFVTPDQLIKIGQVAKKYNASLKITSGQRIAILGLEPQDVEKAWNELGMKPGVKSILSIKNVEMCSASFCKKAKQNSNELGMKIDKLYHGIDMPNRTKISVVGCKNGCTNVYTKDIGIIGTENGYKITVGGSGGSNTKIADILVEDLTEDDVLEVLDTIINYYKKNGKHKEKLNKFIKRIGFEKFRKDILEKCNVNKK
ncbi:NAD(P)/FAD-dependent oxidoreductase [Thermohalobacter berrensis]|uniref:NAD(P)/FAD-dependent oxidoreductase n=1 Tax=Thermohalobacter berrensis TaxID=99594 RepID=UPI001FAB3396|nr:NAD(P)/FAD-dependent oxidoreductase [Thermohalobacter berrensis]